MMSAIQCVRYDTVFSVLLILLHPRLHPLQSGLAEPNQNENSRTEPNRHGGENGQTGIQLPIFGSPVYEPNSTDVSNITARLVFGSSGSVQYHVKFNVHTKYVLERLKPKTFSSFFVENL